MTTPRRVLEIARSQLGIAESPSYSNNVIYSRWYGLKGPWCAMFTSWCLQTAGMPKNSLTHFAWTPGGYSAYRNAGRWYFSGPRVGDLVFFSFSKPSGTRPYGISHIGFVERVNADGSLMCLEGNTSGSGSRDGGSVMRHRRATRLVAGYGRPQYSIEAPQTEEDEVKQEDVDRIADAVFNKIAEKGLAPRTKTAMALETANLVWEHLIEGEPAENRVFNADVRTREIKETIE